MNQLNDLELAILGNHAKQMELIDELMSFPDSAGKEAARRETQSDDQGTKPKDYNNPDYWFMSDETVESERTSREAEDAERGEN